MIVLTRREEGLRGRRAVAVFGVGLVGGLFEGQRHIERDSVPEPRRPYGELKLRQEQLLASSSAPLVRCVYRLTSVYGHAHTRRRQGLIPTLVVNGLRHRVSTIVGW